MSREGIEHIFGHSACLTKRQMKDYVNGVMTSEEAHAVELHLSGCPMCNDAVEGMMAMKDEGAVNMMTELNADFLKIHLDGGADEQVQHSAIPPVALTDTDEKKKGRVVPLWRNLSVAAALLLFIGIGWMLKQRMEEDSKQLPTGIAKNENPLRNEASTAIAEQPTQPTAETLNAAVETKGFVHKTEVTQNSSMSAGADNIAMLSAAKSKELPKDNEHNKAKTVALDAPMLDAYNPGRTQTLTSEQIEKMPTRNVEDMISAAPKSVPYRESPATSNKLNTSLPQRSGPQLSNNYTANNDSGGVKIAGSRTDGEKYTIDGVRVVGSRGVNFSKPGTDKINSGALSDSAASLYKSGRHKEALDVYKQAMNTGKKADQHIAIVGAAKCYIALGDKAEAKKLLEQVIEEGGAMKHEAKKLIKDLN